MAVLKESRLIGLCMSLLPLSTSQPRFIYIYICALPNTLLQHFKFNMYMFSLLLILVFFGELLVQRDFVICKIKNKVNENEDDVPNYEGGESSTVTAACSVDYQNWNCSNCNSTFEDPEVQAHMQSFTGYDQRDYSLNSTFQWDDSYNY